MDLNNTYLQLATLIIGLFTVIGVTKKITKRYIVTNKIEPHRRKLILYLCYLAYYVVFGLLLLLIIGVNLKEIAIFASSILAVLGVGFFAQWSILSNLTASVILFFYHPMRIGDTIRILDKELDFKGVIKDISGFYVLIYIPDEKRKITVPNNVLLYKGIEVLGSEKNNIIV